MSNYTVRKLKIGNTQQMQSLSHPAGELYSRTVASFWRTVRKQDLWLKPSSLMEWLPNDSEHRLHAHRADVVVQNCCGSLKSWRERHKVDPTAKPPPRCKWFYKVQLKSTAIKVKNGKLRLSNGQGNESSLVDWQRAEPKLVKMVWDGKQYEIRAFYSTAQPATVDDGIVAGADLGEIHRAIDIRKKYLGLLEVPAVGVMAAPIGLRFRSHAQFSAVRFRLLEPDIERIPSL